MTDISDEATKLAETVGRYDGAITKVLAALISVLVRNGVISAEIVERELLDCLQETMKPIAQSVNLKDEHSTASDEQWHEAASAEAVVQIVGHIRRLLFP